MHLVFHISEDGSKISSSVIAIVTFPKCGRAHGAVAVLWVFYFYQCLYLIFSFSNFPRPENTFEFS